MGEVVGEALTEEEGEGGRVKVAEALDEAEEVRLKVNDPDAVWETETDAVEVTEGGNVTLTLGEPDVVIVILPLGSTLTVGVAVKLPDKVIEGV